MNLPQLLYLLLPAFAANITPVITKYLPFKHPLDFGLSINKKRILGTNKTIEGLLIGILASTLTTLIQHNLTPTPYDILTYDKWLILGISIGLGALLGDALKSFFKRQFNIAPGKPWPPFDQIDYGIGTTTALLFFINLSPYNILTIIILCGAMHMTTTTTAYFFKLRPNPW